MNAYEYLQALRAALEVLPDEEINSAIRYYEDYFLDAGDENAAKVIEELGPPEQVAQAILNDYTGMTRRRSPHFDEHKPEDEPIEGIPLDGNGKPIPPRKKGINPWLLLALVLLAIPVGIPLIGALFAAIVALIASIAAVVLAVAATLVALPAAAVLGGGVLIAFSFALWASPASALATLGMGLVLAAAGVLLVLLVIKLCILLIPPIVRGLVALIRWPIQKIRDCWKRGASR